MHFTLSTNQQNNNVYHSIHFIDKTCYQQCLNKQQKHVSSIECVTVSNTKSKQLETDIYNNVKNNNTALTTKKPKINPDHQWKLFILPVKKGDILKWVNDSEVHRNL